MERMKHTMGGRDDAGLRVLDDVVLNGASAGAAARPGRRGAGDWKHEMDGQLRAAEVQESTPDTY